MIECGCVPIELYLWALNVEFLKNKVELKTTALPLNADVNGIIFYISIGYIN